jgi:hypothetical protein
MGIWCPSKDKNSRENARILTSVFYNGLCRFVQSLSFCKLLGWKDKMENRGYKGWGVKKVDNRPVKVLMNDCEDPKLAAKIYNLFIGGYTEEEVSEHIGVAVKTVESAIGHMRSCLSSRTIIAHNNDRLRILVQRSESEKFRKLLGDSLSIKAEEYLRAGVSPASTLREFRQTIGLEEKPGGIAFSITKNTAIIDGGNHGGACGTGFRSFEDVVRAVLASDPSLSLSPVENGIEEEATSSNETANEDFTEDVEEEDNPSAG